MSRYTLAQMKAVLAGDMASFFGDSPHPASTATAKADKSPPAPVAAKAAAAAKPKPAKGFWDYVGELMGAGKSKREAVAAAAKEHPDLHQQMLTEHNGQERDRQERDRQKAAAARNSLRRLSASRR